MELAEPLVTINEETGIFIKPDNILLGKDNKLKLSDFGSSLRMNEPEDNILLTLGDIYFFPPELVEDKEKEKKNIDYKAVDILDLYI